MKKDLKFQNALKKEKNKEREIVNINSFCAVVEKIKTNSYLCQTQIKLPRQRRKDWLN